MTFAEQLPRRTAHAVYALMTASKTLNMPVTTVEVLLYDEESLSVGSTGQALSHARRKHLAAYTGKYWVPTFFALDHRKEFEDRYLRDTGESL